MYTSCSEDGGALSFFPVTYMVTVDDFAKTPSLFSYQKQSRWLLCSSQLLSC